MTDVSPITRRWQTLSAVITAISVAGFSLGMSIPLVSLVLEQNQVDSALIGLMAAMPAFGILMFSPLIPSLVALLGAVPVMYLAIAVSGSAVILLPFVDNYYVWLLLRLMLGMADGALFTISETWINQIAEEHNRGRLVAIYATVFSLCLAAGPLLISLTGSEGALPFLVAGGILFAAGLPLRWAWGGTLSLGETTFGVFAFFRVAPTLSAAVLLFAVLDGASIALLPLFGLRHGYEEEVAAMMITALVAGNVALQIPLGWLADRMNRYTLLFICGSGVLIGALLLPLVVENPLLVWPVLVFVGASGGAVYTLALVIVGQRFRGADLVTANAALGVLWGLGSLTGPLAGGLGMRLLNPDGFPLTIALAAVLFLSVFVWRRRIKGTQGKSP